MSTRQQWVSFPKYYRTYSLFTDTKLPFNKPKWIKNEDWIGVGVSLYSDVAGDGVMRNNEGLFTIAFHTPMSVFDLSTSGGIGFYQKSVNFDNLYFNNQWNGFRFDTGISSFENNAGISRTLVLPDITAGVMVNFPASKKEKDYRIQVGLSVWHLMAKPESFYDFNAIPDKRFTYHASYRGPVFSITKKNKLMIEAEFMGLKQGLSEEYLYGANFWTTTSSELSYGIMHRHQREISLIGTYHKIFSNTFLESNSLQIEKIAFSYDYNYIIHANSFEISLLLISNYKTCKCDISDDGNVKSGRGETPRRKSIRGTPQGECNDWQMDKRKGIPDFYFDVNVNYFAGDLNDVGTSNDFKYSLLPTGVHFTFGNGSESYYYGLLMGIEYWKEFFLIPIEMDFKYTFQGFGYTGSNSTMYYGYCDLGYSFRSRTADSSIKTQKGGLSGAIGLGIDVPIRALNNKALNIALGIRQQELVTEYFNQGFGINPKSKLNYLQLKIGLRF